MSTVTPATTLNDGPRQHPAPGPPKPPGLARGELLGRYVVLRELGRGGMGLVLEAYDPELDRRVALKLLRPDRAVDTAESRRHAVAEARALARLAHPNVVAVHDVGEQDQHAFVAMELVDGVSLDAWILRRAPGLREVVGVMLQAARGLLAAHEVGLVHRDFKPANVLVEAGGRARVADFGLAHAIVRPSSSAGAETVPQAEPETIAGTPRYMAPEILDGERPDPRADQYAFGVALFEAIERHPPWSATTLHGLRRQKGRGVPAMARAPWWLMHVVRRSTAIDPARRFGGMDEVVQALERGLGRSRRIALGGGAAVLALVGTAAAIPRTSTCVDEDLVDATWSEARRAEALAGLRTGAPSYADDAWARIDARLQARTSTWRAQARRSCVVAAEDPDDAGAAASRRCLRRSLARLDTLLETVAQGDPEVAARAIEVVEGAELDADCNPDASQDPRESFDEIEDAAVLAVRHDLDAAHMLGELGRYDDALAGARTAVTRGRSLDAPAVTAEALLLEGELLDLAGRRGDALVRLDEATSLAISHSADHVAHRAASVATLVAGRDSHDLALSRQWYRLAKALLGRTAGDPLDAAALEDHVGSALELAGRFEEAEAHYRDALAIREHRLGPSHLELAATYHNLGNLAVRRGEHEEAVGWHRRSLAIRREVAGEQHPLVGLSYNVLGTALLYLGRNDEASQRLGQAQRIMAETLPEEHPDHAFVLNNLAALAVARGELERAEALYGAAEAAFARAWGPRDRHVAQVVHNRADLARTRGDRARAEALFERALVLRQEALGLEHPETQKSRTALAELRDPSR